MLVKTIPAPHWFLGYLPCSEHSYADTVGQAAQGREKCLEKGVF